MVANVSLPLWIIYSYYGPRTIPSQAMSSSLSHLNRNLKLCRSAATQSMINKKARSISFSLGRDTSFFDIFTHSITELHLWGTNWKNERFGSYKIITLLSFWTIRELTLAAHQVCFCQNHLLRPPNNCCSLCVRQSSGFLLITKLRAVLGFGQIWDVIRLS